MPTQRARTFGYKFKLFTKPLRNDLWVSMIERSLRELLVRRLGKSGTSILMRLSAFILFAIGVQIFWNGLSAGIPQILATVASHSRDEVSIDRLPTKLPRVR